MIPSLMEDMGLSTAKIDGVGRVQVSNQLSVKQKDLTALCEWMNRHDHGDMIKDTINSSSLSAFIKAQIAAGEEIPDEKILELNAYSVGTVVKA